MMPVSGFNAAAYTFFGTELVVIPAVSPPLGSGVFAPKPTSAVIRWFLARIKNAHGGNSVPYQILPRGILSAGFVAASFPSRRQPCFHDPSIPTAPEFNPKTVIQPVSSHGCANQWRRDQGSCLKTQSHRFSPPFFLLTVVEEISLTVSTDVRSLSAGRQRRSVTRRVERDSPKSIRQVANVQRGGRCPWTYKYILCAHSFLQKSLGSDHVSIGQAANTAYPRVSDMDFILIWILFFRVKHKTERVSRYPNQGLYI
ncbi:hypothetical protein B0H11DRAFT_360887 [Mycena galericulata]|nr:hypothetical protein B0H11DRAFT_360887 [Mycena galericulata]